MKRALVVIFSILFIDQFVKFLVKMNMPLGDEFPLLGDWFIIHFTENNGMAFGLEFAGEYGKLFLSIFRILAVAGIGYYLWRLIKDDSPKGLIVSISLIFSGALGNIIDSTFYGLIFNDSMGQVASFMPAEGGYAGFLHGKVVDMLYFPMIEGYFPDWFPFWANESFLFFRPVFNIADSAISVGVGMIIIFQRSFFASQKSKEGESTEDDNQAEEVEPENSEDHS